MKFGKSDGFQLELRRRVDEFLEKTGRRPRDCWQMYLKTAILLSVYGASYVLFDGEFAQELIALGRRDAERQHNEILEFFDRLRDTAVEARRSQS